MSKPFVTFQVKSPGVNKDFETCNTCIHADDSSEICQLRLCVHAFHEMKECYEGKGGQRMNIDDVIRELECHYVQGYPEYWDYHENAVEILKAVKKFMGKFENKTCTNFGRTEFMSEELYNTVSELLKGDEE